MFFQIINFFLYPVQKSGSVCPIHLRMVELERNGQCRFQPMTFVLAPNEKRIVEDSAIHTYRPVYFVLRQCGSADNHAFHQVMVRAAFGDLPGKLQVMFVEQE